MKPKRDPISLDETLAVTVGTLAWFVERGLETSLSDEEFGALVGKCVVEVLRREMLLPKKIEAAKTATPTWSPEVA